MADVTSHAPAELLAACFQFLDLRQLIAASHVSRFWRDSAIAFPALWSRLAIDAGFNDPANVLCMAVRRSGQLPVDLEYLQTDDERSRYPHRVYREDGYLPCGLNAAMGRHLHRFRSIKWKFDLIELDLKSPAPILEELVSYDGTIFIPRDFLGGSPANLRTLRLGDALFPETCPALSTVIHLRAIYSPDSSNDTRFHRIFDLCPRLEILHLRDLCGRPGAELPQGPAPRTLHTVKLKAASTGGCDLIQLYRAWRLGFVPQLRLTMPLTQPFDTSPVIDGAPNLCVSFMSDNRTHFIARFADGRRHTLVFYNLTRASAALMAGVLRVGTALTQVRALEIPLSVLGALMSASASLRLPQVVRLAVIFFEDDPYDALPSGVRWAALDRLRLVPQCFPSVSTLHLVVCADYLAPLPGKDDARQFVRSLSAMLGDTAINEVRIYGFPDGVVHEMDTRNTEKPRIVFTTDTCSFSDGHARD